MPSDESSRDDLLRRFEEAISGMELSELHDGVAGFLNSGAYAAALPQPPELRRSPLSEPVILTVRVDLQGAKPPIWRRLELRSDLTLDTVHQILQTSFGWWDYHLHRFALGGHPFDRDSQLFLCPFDVQDGEDQGTPTAQVRLDETLQEPGDRLQYLYDYGDDWHLLLKVEAVRPAATDDPRATAVGGRRAAPPEDSGGIADAEFLAEVLDDPAHFDLHELNEELTVAGATLTDHGVHPALQGVMDKLRHTPAGADLDSRAVLLLMDPEPPEQDELEAALQPVTWFLGRAASGIGLTSAGYLRPADVEQASQVVPEMAGWIGKNNRESLTYPLLFFRESLQKLKLLRKYKGKLLATKAAAAVHDDPRSLWDLLAGRLIPAAGTFEHDATVVLLAHVATTPPEQEVSLDAVADALTQIGWRVEGGHRIPDSLIRDLPACILLRNVTAQPRTGRRYGFSPEAASLARAALRA